MAIIDQIIELVTNINPLDELERSHKQSILTWLSITDDVFRRIKPDIPDIHLVAYFVLYDAEVKKVLLVDHKKAQLWLPTGGHVEPGEHPKLTVQRECQEELSICAEFIQELPVFLTSTQTVGLTAGHTDVSLWYLLRGDSEVYLEYDQEEFNSVHWFNEDELPFEKSDPHMQRFMEKLRIYASTSIQNIA